MKIKERDKLIANFAEWLLRTQRVSKKSQADKIAWDFLSAVATDETNDLQFWINSYIYKENK